MYCPQCGVNNDRGEANCYICGSALPAIASAAAEPSAKRRKSAAASAAEKPATVGDRAIALLFDRLVIAALLAAGLAGTEMGQVDVKSTTDLATAIAISGGAVLLYHFIFEAAIGTTLGKAMMSLQIRTEPGRNRFLAMLLRNVLRVVDSIGFYLLGFLFAVFTQKGQRVGDLVGGTVVMEKPPNNKLRAGLMVLWLVIAVAAGWFAAALTQSRGLRLAP